MADPLRFTSLDHISLTVANLQRSLDFYSRVFGDSLRKESESDRYYVRLGTSYLALGQAAQGCRSGYIDHFCAGCEGRWLQPIEDHLKEIGVVYTTPQPYGIFFTDPDGIRIKLWPGDSWLDVARTAPVFAKQVVEPSLFEPQLIMSLSISLPDQQKSMPYYMKLFGDPFAVFMTPSETDLFRLGKSMLHLNHGATADITSASIRVSAIPADAASNLQALGATVDRVDGNSLSFQDPDGIRLLIQPEQQLTSMPPA